MINSIAPYIAPNVPNRNKVQPIGAIACVEMNPQHSNSDYLKREKSNANKNAQMGNLYQNYSPLFAIHVLVEAKVAQTKDQINGINAYNPQFAPIKNLIAVA